MPFGLNNAPRTFQKAVKNILGDLTYAKTFLDDILVHSESLSDHREHLMKY